MNDPFPYRITAIVGASVLKGGSGGGGGLTGPGVFDAGSQLGSPGTGTSISWSHTCTGSNLGLFVGAEWFSSGSGGTATYNGASMTSVGTVTGLQTQQATMWKLSAPASGANTVVVTPPASKDEIAGCAVSFTNVHQTTASLTGTPVTATDCTAGINVGSAADEIVVDVAGSFGAALAPAAAGQTERADCAFAGVATCAMSTKAGEASTALDWTNTAPDGHIGVSVITS